MSILNFNLEGLKKVYDSSFSTVSDLIDRIISAESDEGYIAPDLRDLSTIFSLICTVKPNRVIEYGCGYSSIVIYSALASIGCLPRSNTTYQIIDAHSKYLDVVHSRLANLNLKTPSIDLFTNQCNLLDHPFRSDGSHIYSADYSFIPEFIYLDAPDPRDISDSKFSANHSRPPISSDILEYESMLEPGTFLLIDGRTLNYRYLTNKLYRNWLWTELDDQYIGFLDEKPLGLRSEKRLRERGLLR